MHIHRLIGIAALVAAAAAGTTFAQGQAGVSGTSLSSLGSINDLNGLTCSSGGDAGTIAVSTAADGNVTFKCKFTTRGPVLRINEVMTASAISAASEFVELVNTGSVRADLTGFRLVYRSSTGTSEETLAAVPAGATLDPGARYVFGGTTFWGQSNQTYNSGMASAGGGVGLRNPTGQLVDSVGYGVGTTNIFVEGAPAAAPTAGGSISRLPDGHDSNNNSADFSSLPPVTPGAVNHP